MKAGNGPSLPPAQPLSGFWLLLSWQLCTAMRTWLVCFPAPRIPAVWKQAGGCSHHLVGALNLKIIPWSALPSSTPLTKELHAANSFCFNFSWCFWLEEPSHKSPVLLERLLPLFSFYLEQSQKGNSGGVCTSTGVEPRAAIRKGSGRGNVHVAVVKLSALVC